jgi:hypothetical protein
MRNEEEYDIKITIRAEYRDVGEYRLVCGNGRGM